MDTPVRGCPKLRLRENRGYLSSALTMMVGAERFLLAF